MLVARREERKITVRVVILIEQLINQELHDGEVTECGASFTVPIFPLIDPPREVINGFYIKLIAACDM